MNKPAHRPKLLLTRKLPDTVESAACVKFDVTTNPGDRALSRDDLQLALTRYDAILTTVTDSFSAYVFTNISTRCRILANFGVGYSHIDLMAAKNAGMHVTNTPDVLTDCTADLAMTLILMAARRAGEGDRLVRRGHWKGWTPTQLMGTSLTGKTLGIIGFGRIGRAVAKRAHFGFGMNILVSSRTPPSQDHLSETGAQPATSMESLLEKSDVVSLHCPGGADNRYLLGAARLALMKTTAILVNTSRGEVIDEQALATALATGKISAAGLDVYENEPVIHPDLLKCENAVLLPHIGSATVETREAMGMRALENLVAFFENGRPMDLVV